MHQEFNGYMSALGLSYEEFENGIAAGVSGGSDSMAMTLLLEAWCRERDIPFVALVCDHGLRSESRQEAMTVVSRLEKKGIETKMLSLGLEPGSAIQERARNARYKAMASYMRHCDPPIGVLAVAHHAMDQAETLAHRLDGGTSTILGRAGMLPVRVMDEMLLIRPLLECGRGSLRDFLREEKVPWVEDPSNQNRMFTRVRWREYLSKNPERVMELLLEAEKGLHIAHETEDEKKEILRKAVVNYEDFGAAIVDMSCVPENLAGAEAIREMIIRASGRNPKADMSSFLSCRKSSRTIGGAQISHDGNIAWVFRETAQMQPPVAASAFSSWDGRIRIGYENQHGVISALGNEDASKMRRRYRELKIPHKVLSSAPCLRREGRIFSIPQLGIGQYVETIPVRRSMPTLKYENVKPDFEQSSLTHGL